MRTMHHRRTNGFTLIEIAIVVAIIGILAAVVIPAIVRYRERTAAQPHTHSAAVEAANAFGIREGAVIAEHLTSSAPDAVCRAEGDTAYDVEGLDSRKRRVRLLVCCRQTSGSPTCAVPQPQAAPPER